MNEAEQIVKIIAHQTQILMANHWSDISDFRDNDEKIKVGFSHHITYQGQERIIESTISFGKRVKDTNVDRFDTEQIGLNLSGNKQSDGADPVNFFRPEAEPAAQIKPVKRRGRPPGSGKRNILEKTLKSGPQPDQAA